MRHYQKEGKIKLPRRNLPRQKNTKKTKKEEENKAQEAHEAIRPTKITTLQVKDSMFPKEKKMYALIWKNTVESCMSPAKYSSLTVKITAPEDHLYKYSTELAIFPGWKIVNGYEKENPLYQYLLSLKNDSILDYKKVTSKVTMKDLKSHYTEAKLVQILEQKGIGRPSTFSSLIDKIQERDYVKKENVKGKEIECIDFELVDVEITETTTKREFGNEKNKLVIQPLGIMVIEFLLKNFNPLFEYNYTKEMEDTLDIIAKGESIWHELCQNCLEQIETLSEKVGHGKREEYQIDEDHIYMIGKYGPVIKCTKTEKATFLYVRKDIDMQKLKEGKYTLKELVIENPSKGRILGKYKDEDLLLKQGKFGLYAEWGENKKSLSYLKKEAVDITFEEVIKYIEESPSGNQNIIRKIDDVMSIRKGKFGNYIFYKTEKMKKPKFLKLNKFKEDYKVCEIEILKDWILETYFN